MEGKKSCKLCSSGHSRQITFYIIVDGLVLLFCLFLKQSILLYTCVRVSLLWTFFALRLLIVKVIKWSWNPEKDKPTKGNKQLRNCLKLEEHLSKIPPYTCPVFITVTHTCFWPLKGIFGGYSSDLAQLCTHVSKVTRNKAWLHKQSTSKYRDAQ